MGKKKEFHGDTKTDLYSKWSSMINRCKPGRFSKTYFDRGITVCHEWSSYLNFKSWALSNGYQKDLELDRRDNDKGYSPENCRFITKLENNSNRSNTIFVEYKGERISLTLFAEKNNLPINVYNTIRRRIKNGWEVEKAIETPVKELPKKEGQFVKVLNTETNEIFDSVKDAANSLNIRSNNLSMMLNGTRTNTTKMMKHQDSPQQ